MQTITVAKINEVQFDTGRFMTRVRRTSVRRQLKVGEDRFEELEAPFVERLQSNIPQVNGVVTAVVCRRRPGIVAETSVQKGLIAKIETEEEIEDFARAWIGHQSYALYCFFSGFPGGKYPGHRLLLAQSLTQDRLDDEQRLVVPAGYDLPSVRERFGSNVWDQNFRRADYISRGRIGGTAMRRDPLYEQFQDIETYIGVEIPIVGSQQMVKVFSDGRLQFMGLQPAYLETAASRDSALDTVLSVLDALSPCEV